MLIFICQDTPLSEVAIQAAGGKGGSAVLVRNSIAHDALPPVIEIEVQVARILKLNNRSYQIGPFYSDPLSRLTRGLLQSIEHELRGQFLLRGDFNSNHPR